MPFNLIKGTFHVQGYQPDGDTIRFRANDNRNWELLGGPPVRLNRRSHASLRFEAIDALETHYQGTHQPEEWGNASTDRLIELAGISSVTWSENRQRVTEANDGTPGYILSRSTERYRRPVAFVFSGTTERADGDVVRLEVDLLEESINYQLAAEGLVYPTYYEGLFSSLRNKITEVVQNARNNNLGLWSEDRTVSGFSISSLDDAQNVVMMPKLFRRIISWLRENDPSLRFSAYMDDRDPIIDLRLANFTHFDSVIEESDNNIQLATQPENLVFRP